MRKLFKSGVKNIFMAVLMILSAFCFAGCDDPVPTTPPAWSLNYELPDETDVKNRLLKIYGSEESIYLLRNNEIWRMPCPNNQDTIILNMTFELGEYTKIVFEDSVDELNDIFAVINPNYKIKINYKPTDKDFDYKYSVRMKTVQDFSSANTLGTANISYMGDGNLGYFGINIKESVLNDGYQMASVFKHEFMHLLGAGDAYKNENATKNTIMQGYSPNGPFSLTDIDIAFLDAMYRNPDIEHSNEYMMNYIDNYTTTNVHNVQNLKSRVYNRMLTNISLQDLNIQLDALSYAPDLISSLKENLRYELKIDKTFGLSEVSFGELLIIETNSQYQYWYGNFDPSTNKYTHSYVKNNSSSAVSSTYNKYDYYNEGIVLGFPNGSGNATFYVRVNDYVLSLKELGDFYDLKNLGVSLNKVFKVTTIDSYDWLTSLKNGTQPVF